MSRHSSSGRAWMTTKQTVLNAHGYICYYCGDIGTQVDHVIPKALGGTDTMDNMVACCKRCNLAKGSKLLSDSLLMKMRKDKEGRMTKSVNGRGYVNGERIAWINTNLLDPSLMDGDYQVDDSATVYNNKTKPYRKVA